MGLEIQMRYIKSDMVGVGRKLINDIYNSKADFCPIKCDIEDIKAEISEYKDDKVIHAERNEMIDIVLEIISKHTKGDTDATEKS